MKIITHNKVPKSKYGRVIISNHDMKPHERSAIDCLASFGFDVETVIPSNTSRMNNPDIIMLGTVWEIKSPIKFNKNTMKNRFRKAIKQANGRTIFDLRNIDKEKIPLVQEHIITMFKESREMRRILIIPNNEKIVDIWK